MKNYLKIKIFGLVILGITICGNVTAQNNVPQTGSSTSPVWILDVAGSLGGTGTTGPWLHVDGDALFTNTPVTGIGDFKIAAPNAEIGHSMVRTSNSNRADVRFDGTTLKLVTRSGGGVPANENGIAINTSGFAGFGNNSPYARIHLSDPNSINYGAYFNSNSAGPTVYINHDASGATNPSGYVSLSEHSALVVTNSYNAVSGNYTCAGMFKARNVGVYALAYGTQANDFSTGLYALANVASGTTNTTSTGILAQSDNAATSYGLNAISNSVSTNGTAYGVDAAASCTGASGTTSIGVRGAASGASINYGVIGLSPGGGSDYGGWFNSQVYCNGTVIGSDRKLKENIKPLVNSLEIINSLNPSNYIFKQSSDYLGLNLPKGLRYGLIAQEVELVIPEIVREVHNLEIRNKDSVIISKAFDFKGVDYISLIPILIGGIKEQQKQIENLKSQISNLKINSNELGSSIPNTGNKSDNSILYQNIPNPSGESTIIKYSLYNPKSRAEIIIFDLNGTLIKSYSLDLNSKDGEVSITSGELKPGMFIYSLTVDNNLIDSKRMIISK